MEHPRLAPQVLHLPQKVVQPLLAVTGELLLRVLQQGGGEVAQLRIVAVGAVQLLADHAHPVEEPSRIVVQHRLLQIGQPRLQLLDVGQVVPDQVQQQRHQKAVRAVRQRRALLRQAGGAVRRRLVVIHHQQTAIRPCEAQTVGGLIGTRRRAQVSGNAGAVDVQPAKLRLMWVGRRSRHGQSGRQRRTVRLLRRKDGQHAPSVRRWNGLGL